MLNGPEFVINQNKSLFNQTFEDFTTERLVNPASVDKLKKYDEISFF